MTTDGEPDSGPAAGAALDACAGAGANVGVLGAPAPHDLGWALTTVLRAYIRSADRVLDGLPGGHRSYRLLSSLRGDQFPSQLALAERIGLDRTVVTYLLDDLAGAGLVERRPDPVDRRVRRVVLTETGAERLADFESRLRLVEEHVFGALGEQEADHLHDLLGRVAQSVSSADPTTCTHVAELAAACENALSGPDTGAVVGRTSHR